MGMCLFSPFPWCLVSFSISVLVAVFAGTTLRRSMKADLVNPGNRYCGITNDYCGEGCQTGFGKCGGGVEIVEGKVKKRHGRSRLHHW